MNNIFYPNFVSIYGLDANVASAPYAAFLSILLISGIEYIGSIFLRYFFSSCFKLFPWFRWQGTLIGTSLISIVIYPVLLFGNITKSYFYSLALLIIFLGGWNIFVLIKKLKSNFKNLSLFNKLNLYDYLIFFFILGFFLLAISPVTDADSLDYHVGVAINILNTGTFPVSPEWFHSRLAGSGEALIAIGLSIGAEQFGPLLQFSGLLGIFGLFKDLFPVNNNDKKWQKNIILIVLSCPVFLALIPTSKSLVLPIAMTSFGLAIANSVLLNNPKKLINKDLLKSFFIACMLIMTAATMKMNFFISAFVIGLMAIYFMQLNKIIIPATFIASITFTFILLPLFLWKYKSYGGNLLDSFHDPFPGNFPGYNNFHLELKAYKDNPINFPFSLFIPFGFGFLTSILGTGFFFITIYTKLSLRVKKFRFYLYAAIILACLEIILGQSNSRFLMEPFLWLLIPIAYLGLDTKLRINSWMANLVVIQSSIVFLIIIFGVYTLFPGSINNELREKTMRRHAYGYAIMKWLDTKLPADAKVIINHRSIGLSPRNSIDTDWKSHVRAGGDGELTYLKITNNKNPNFLLTSLPVNVNPKSLMERCNIKFFAGPFVQIAATRNPFNSGEVLDAWWIMKYDKEKSKCIN